MIVEFFQFDQCLTFHDRISGICTFCKSTHSRNIGRIENYKTRQHILSQVDYLCDPISGIRVRLFVDVHPLMPVYYSTFVKFVLIHSLSDHVCMLLLQCDMTLI